MSKTNLIGFCKAKNKQRSTAKAFWYFHFDLVKFLIKGWSTPDCQNC